MRGAVDAADGVGAVGAGDAHHADGRVAPEMGGPFGVGGPAACPHIQQVLLCLDRPIEPGCQHTDAEHDEHFVLHIVLFCRLRYGIQRNAAETQLRSQDLMAVAAGQNAILDGLALPADGIAVQITIHVIELLHVLEVSVDVVVIFIKGVLRQRDAGSAQKLCAEGTGVDHQDLIHPEPAHLVPAEDGFPGEGVGKADGSVALSIGMDIAVVGQEQVYPAPGLAGFQRIQKCRKIAAQGIIAVHTLEVFSSGQGHAPVDA